MGGKESNQTNNSSMNVKQHALSSMAIYSDPEKGIYGELFVHQCGPKGIQPLYTVYWKLVNGYIRYFFDILWQHTRVILETCKWVHPLFL